MRVGVREALVASPARSASAASRIAVSAGSVVLEQAALGVQAVLAAVDEAVQQRVKRPHPGVVGAVDPRASCGVQLGVAAAAISACTDSEEPAAAAVSHHASPPRGGRLARPLPQGVLAALVLAEVQRLESTIRAAAQRAVGASAGNDGRPATARAHASTIDSR